MKKVVFLIGMVMGLSFGSFGQYDVVTVSSEDGIENFDTWYQVKGEVGMFYFFGEIDDETMDDYIKEYLEYMGGDFSKPTRIDKEDGLVSRVYEGLDGDGTQSTVVVCYSEEDNVVSIIKAEE
ncbi:MAG: hypothetical protein RLZZ181_423 [Pseudomonadota bacterium]|jgi:hypothetical protein